MAKNLDDAQDAILNLISEIDGLRSVSNPQERFSADPFAVVFPGAGEWVKSSSGYVTGLGSIILEIHKIRKDLPRDLKIIKPFGELVMQKLLADANITLPDTGGDATVDVVNRIGWNFGPMGWAEIPTIGWEFEIEVKIESTV